MQNCRFNGEQQKCTTPESSWWKARVSTSKYQMFQVATVFTHGKIPNVAVRFRFLAQCKLLIGDVWKCTTVPDGEGRSSSPLVQLLL